MFVEISTNCKKDLKRSGITLVRPFAVEVDILNKTKENKNNFSDFQM